MQHDLFPRRSDELELTPAPGRSEPRLWVRRLVVWRDADDVLREVTLKPGLNIVWSPDAATDGASIGHGSGKTTFCRLLRYCLGEDSFAPSAQRRATLAAMPNGRVGAEVRLDGQDWAIVRSFNPSGGDWALANQTLQEISAAEPSTGMELFKRAATRALLNAAVPLMPKFIDDASAWPAVLAWLTRDQECRFAHLLDWRDKDSDSNSPVRGRSVDDRLTIARAVLGALKPEELATGAAREVQAQLASRLRAAVGRLDWQAGRSRNELASSLGFSSDQLPSELDAASFASAASEQLAKASGVERESDSRALDAAQEEQDGLEAQERAADLALASRRIEIGERQKLVKFLRDELPQLSASAATVPLCSTCKAPIGDVHNCDTTTQTAELNRKQQNYQQEDASLFDLQSSESGLQYALAVASQRRKQQRELFDGLRKAALNRSVDVRCAQQLVADAHRYRGCLKSGKRQPISWGKQKQSSCA